MKKQLTLIALFGVMFCACNENKKENFDIKPLVDFIEQTNTSPVDYIMGLFEKYDVVVLGERDHRDMTQYDLIQQVISDPRFIEKVGNVFTEVGVYNMADELNAVLKGTYPNDEAFDKELVNVLFYMDFMPLWDKANYTKLMKDIYLVNKNLPTEKKINVTPTEFPFSWKQAQTMTTEEFETTIHKIWKPYKDVLLANNAINELYKIFNGNEPRKKALIIYNTPHSCRFYENTADRFQVFAYQIIADRFPGRVANVMLNWASIVGDEYTLSNDGKIDAAFATCDYKSIGFDLANSPFENFLYDVNMPPSTNKVKMKDVFHGFIYYKPIYEWVYGVGVPNLEKVEGAREELARRSQVFRNENIPDEEWEEYKDDVFWYYSTVRFFPEFAREEYYKIEPLSNPKHFYEQISKYYKNEK
jgi:hypothetical protein